MSYLNQDPQEETCTEVMMVKDKRAQILWVIKYCGKSDPEMAVIWVSIMEFHAMSRQIACKSKNGILH